MDLKIPAVLRSGTFTLQPYGSFFRKFSIEVEMHHVGLNSFMSKSPTIQFFSNQGSKYPLIHLKILTDESSMRSYVKYRVKPWELIQFKG